MFNPAVPLDAWIQADQVPWIGHVRVGLQKEWFSLEHTESARYLTFIERSYLFDAGQPTAFNNARTPGVSTFRTWSDGAAFTAIGIYKNINGPFGFGVGDGEYAVTGRVAGLPVYQPDKQRYWMVGGGMSHRDPANDTVRVRVRSSVRGQPGPLLNLLADTGNLSASSQTLFNLQTAAGLGRWTMTAEYLANLVRSARVGSGPNLGTVTFQGFYIEGLAFLTDEHRSFDTKYYRRARVIPKDNLSEGGWGVWELGLRYQHLDLDEGGVRGGRLNNVTVGLNWYWNPNMKLQFNYDYTHRDGGANPLASGQVHGFGTRVAFDF